MKKHFFKDKHNQIDKLLASMCRIIGNPNYPSQKKERFSDNEMNKLRKLSSDMVKQINELNAGRNIFMDNDKDNK